MRFKSLLGLLAIGGAVAYAQKKRGGDMSLAGIKNSLRSVADSVRSKLGGLSASTGTNATSSASAESWTKRLAPRSADSA